MKLSVFTFFINLWNDIKAPAPVSEAGGKEISEFLTIQPRGRKYLMRHRYYSLPNQWSEADPCCEQTHPV